MMYIAVVPGNRQARRVANTLATPSSHPLIVALTLVVFIGWAHHGHVQALTTKILAHQEFCFTESVPKDVPLHFQFQVTEGGHKDIDCTITDASGRKLHSWKSAPEGHYALRGDSSNTKFKFCFINAMATFSPKFVSFHCRRGLHPSAVKIEELDPIEQQIDELNERVGDLRDQHTVLHNVERDHRATVEDITERVLLWKAFEVLVLIGLGLSHIVFLKRFLEVRASA